MRDLFMIVRQPLFLACAIIVAVTVVLAVKR